jgi:hypothetical protein
MSSRLQSRGATGFSQEYWEQNYHDPSSMDGIGNAKEHALYLKYLFGIEYIDVSSIIDFGFGLGYLFEEFLKTFVPYKAYGIEPSEHAFKQVKERDIRPVDSMKLSLYQQDLVNWCRKPKGRVKRFDLGICTSVFQYLSEEELREVIPVMAQRVKYLYLSVPTNIELKRQVDELEFDDTFSYKRSRTFYQRLLRKNFTFISSRLLESKDHFDEFSTSFTDLLYRF